MAELRLRTRRSISAAVVPGQQALRPDRHLVAQQRRQQCAALVAPGQRGSPQRGRVRRADQRDGAHQPRMQHRGGPADQPAVGVADQRRRRVPERADQPGRVAGQRPAVVAAGRLVAAAVAAQVDRDHPGPGQAAQLVAPRPPERAEAVQQHHQRPRGGRLGARPWPAGSASTTWNRMPLACTSRWRHGPSMRVTDGSGAAIYQPEGSVGLAASGWRASGASRSARGRGLVVAGRERGAGLLDRFDGLPRSPDPAHLQETEAGPARRPTTTMIANTIRNATQRHSQLSSSSARKKKKKNVE